MPDMSVSYPNQCTDDTVNAIAAESACAGAALSTIAFAPTGIGLVGGLFATFGACFLGDYYTGKALISCGGDDGLEEGGATNTQDPDDDFGKDPGLDSY